jgi:hypothetical protein
MSGSKSRGQVVDKQAREFKDLRPGLADLISGTFGDITNFMSGDLGFDGSEIDLDRFRAPMTLGETDALEGLGRLNEGSENEMLSSDLMRRTLSGDFLSRDSNPELADLIRFTNKEINSAFNDQGLATKSLFARAGQTLPESSPFSDAAAKLEAGRLDAIGKNVSTMAAANYQAERDRQVQAVEQTRATAGFEFSRQLEFLQANALPRLIDEIGFDRAFTEFQTRLAALSQALGIAAGITSPALGVETMASGGGVLSGGTTGAPGGDSSGDPGGGGSGGFGGGGSGTSSKD